MKKIMLLTAIGAVTLLSSCKTSGCTEVEADNYAENADLDDGSCTYTADVVLYLNEARHEYYMDNDEFYPPFHFIVDDQEIGQLSVSNAAFETHETPPDCNGTNDVYSNGRFHFQQSITEKTSTFRVYIKDQLENEHGSFNVTATQGECNPVLL